MTGLGYDSLDHCMCPRVEFSWWWEQEISAEYELSRQRLRSQLPLLPFIRHPGRAEREKRRNVTQIPIFYLAAGPPSPEFCAGQKSDVMREGLNNHYAAAPLPHGLNNHYAAAPLPRAPVWRRE